MLITDIKRKTGHTMIRATFKVDGVQTWGIKMLTRDAQHVYDRKGHITGARGLQIVKQVFG